MVITSCKPDLPSFPLGALSGEESPDEPGRRSRRTVLAVLLRVDVKSDS